MADKKYLFMLQMARRAGKLSMGHDVAMKSLKSNKAKAVIFSKEMSPRLIEEFEAACKRLNREIPRLIIGESICELYDALGYKAGVMTVDDDNFSKRITELIYQEENAYGN